MDVTRRTHWPRIHRSLNLFPGFPAFLSLVTLRTYSTFSLIPRSIIIKSIDLLWLKKNCHLYYFCQRVIILFSFLNARLGFTDLPSSPFVPSIRQFSRILDSISVLLTLRLLPLSSSFLPLFNPNTQVAVWHLFLEILSPVYASWRAALPWFSLTFPFLSSLLTAVTYSPFPLSSFPCPTSHTQIAPSFQAFLLPHQLQD